LSAGQPLLRIFDAGIACAAGIATIRTACGVSDHHPNRSGLRINTRRSKMGYKFNIMAALHAAAQLVV